MFDTFLLSIFGSLLCFFLLFMLMYVNTFFGVFVCLGGFFFGFFGRVFLCFLECPSVIHLSLLFSRRRAGRGRGGVRPRRPCRLGRCLGVFPPFSDLSPTFVRDLPD